MVTSKRVATTITLSDLSKSLAKASVIAAKEHDVKISAEAVVLGGNFFGKIVTPSSTTTVDPMAVARSISKGMGAGGKRIPGTVAWPTPNWPKGPILVGFWDPLPKTFHF